MEVFTCWVLIDQVCGLKWSHDDRELASGGNDNQVHVRSPRSHNGSVKKTSGQRNLLKCYC